MSTLKNNLSLLMLLIAVGVIGIISMPRQEYSGDPQVVRCETVSLIEYGTFEIPSRIARELDNGSEIYFFKNPSNQKYYSKYGILNSLLYVPVLLVEKWHDARLTYFSDDRVIYLNCFNIILTIASAWYLYLITYRYAVSRAVTILYVLTALYCTFWWNYLRAQNSDIYQTLFLLGLYHHLTSSFGAADGRRNRLLAGAYLGALILVKLFFLVLVPIVLLFAAVAEWRRLHAQGKAAPLREGVAALRPAIWVALPVFCAVGTLLLANTVQYGSPVETGWRGPQFGGNFLAGLHGFTLERRHSIFLYFPIFTFALIGYPAFFREHRMDCLLFLTIGGIVLLFCSKLGDWVGGWGYGPRYMLPYLPLLSLPFIKTMQFISRKWWKWWVAIAAGAMAGALCWSFKTQVEVNAVPFFAYYRLQIAFAPLRIPEIKSYFEDRTFGGLAKDLLAFKAGKPWRALELARPALNDNGIQKFTEVARENSASNYYFWRDASPAPGSPPNYPDRP